MLTEISLLRYWSQAVSALVAGLVVYSICDFLYTRKAEYVAAMHRQELAAQSADLTQKFIKAQQVTVEVSNAYQEQLTDLRNQLATVKRVQPNRCIATPSRTAIGRDAAAPDAQLPQPDGVFTDDLYDFAADAEQVGRQLDACQNFISKAWGLYK